MTGMFFEHHTRRTWVVRVAGAIFLLIALAAVLLHNRNRRPEPAARSPTAAVTATTNASTAASAGVPFDLKTNSPGSTLGPGVAELAQRMTAWQQAHPNYQLLVETTGPDLAMTAEVFRFTKQPGSLVHRVKTVLRAPLPLTLVTELEGDRIRAYFPEANQVVEMERAEETRRLPGQAGWLGSGLDAAAMLSFVRASFVESGPDYQALTLMLSGSALQLPQAVGDMFLTIRVDENGKMLSLEQLTLGMKVVSKFTYMDDNSASIEEKSPKIPGTAVVAKKTFREALEEQVEPKKKGSAKRITI